MQKSSNLKKPSRGHLLYKDERIESKEIIEVEKTSSLDEPQKVRDSAQENSLKQGINEEDESEFCK